MRTCKLGILSVVAFLPIVFCHADSAYPLSEADTKLLQTYMQRMKRDLPPIPFDYAYYELKYEYPEAHQKIPEFRIYSEKNRKSPLVIELKDFVFQVHDAPACRLSSSSYVDGPEGLIFTDVAHCPLVLSPNSHAICERDNALKSCKPIQSFIIHYSSQEADLTNHHYAIPIVSVDEKAGFAEIAPLADPKLFSHPLFLDTAAWTPMKKPERNASIREQEGAWRKKIAPFLAGDKLKQWATEARACFDQHDAKCIARYFDSKIEVETTYEDETGEFACKKIKQSQSTLVTSDVFPCLWKNASSTNSIERNLLVDLRNCLDPSKMNGEGDLELSDKENEITVHTACGIPDMTCNCKVIRDPDGKYRLKYLTAYHARG